MIIVGQLVYFHVTYMLQSMFWTFQQAAYVLKTWTGQIPDLATIKRTIVCLKNLIYSRAPVNL